MWRKKVVSKVIANDSILDMFWFWLLNLNCNVIEIKATVDANFKHAFDFSQAMPLMYGVYAAENIRQKKNQLDSVSHAQHTDNWMTMNEMRPLIGLQSSENYGFCHHCWVKRNTRLHHYLRTLWQEIEVPISIRFD